MAEFCGFQDNRRENASFTFAQCWEFSPTVGERLFPIEPGRALA
jgi:hypothetical protein